MIKKWLVFWFSFFLVTSASGVTNSFKHVVSGGGSFSPDDIASITLWIDADGSDLWEEESQTTLATADGDPICGIEELAQGHDPGNSDGTECAEYVASAQNGKPGIKFDGANSFLYFNDTGTPLNDAYADITVFAAFQFDGIKTYGRVFSLFPATGGATDNNNDDGMIVISGNSGGNGNKPGSWRYGGNLNEYSNEALTSYGIVRVQADIENGEDYLLHVDGVQKASDTVFTGHSGGMQPTRFTLGNRFDENRPSQYTLLELIVYNEYLSASDISDVETYLQNKWDL